MRIGGFALLLVAGTSFAQTPLPPVDTPPPSGPGPGPEPPSPGPPEPGTPPPQQPPSPQQQPPPTTYAPAPESKLWMGPQLDILPLGTIHLSALGMDVSGDANSAVGLGGLIDYRVHPIFTIGFAPRFIVPVKPDEANESGSELDLRARFTAGKDLSPQVRLYGIGTIGYSWIFRLLRDTSSNDYHTSSGLTLGFGGGINFAINPRLVLVGELSYQFGFQRTTISGIEVDADTSYLTLGVGIVFPL